MNVQHAILTIIGLLIQTPILVLVIKDFLIIQVLVNAKLAIIAGN